MKSYKFFLIASKLDEASMTLFRNLFNFEELKEIEEGKIYESKLFSLELIDKELIFSDDLPYKEDFCYIFLSKHRSESKIPTLTSHFPGNLCYDNSLGGNKREVAYCWPSLLKSYITHIYNLRDKVSHYQITLEPTHHGPTSSKSPFLFVELGSKEENWRDDKAAKVVCEALVNTLKEEVKLCDAALALGGPHYSEKFTNYLIKGDIPIAHMVPKYSLSCLDEFMMDHIMRKSIQPIKYALLNGKGLGKEKERIIKLIQDFGLEVIKL
ncbi:MAG: D-aminoacyl-tRNA deacylase [Nitrososphaerales archaeon]